MAAPNIVSVTTITAKTQGATLGTSSADIVANSASSGKVLKVNTILLANKTGSTVEASITFEDYGGSGYYVVYNIDVPAEGTIVALDRNSVLYLEEGDSIAGSAGSGSSIDVIVSYEEIS
jgi:hypothetical protein